MKMTAEELKKWCDKLNLSREAREEAIRIRSSEPARSTNSGPSNVSGIFNKSWKMGHSVQFESHTVEYPGVLMYEDPDNDVIEYWDQANKFTVHVKDSKGKSRGHKCTPDFFVIRQDSAGWEEWKTEEKLLKLAQKYPERYYYDGDQWYYAPGEEYAKRFGFYFRLRSSAEINYVLTRNANVLHRFHKPGYKSVVDTATVDLIHSFLEGRPQTMLSSLIEFAEERFSTGCIYELIATKRIYVNIYRDLLTEPERTYVYLTKDDAIFYDAVPVSGSCTTECAQTKDIVPGTKAFFDGKPIKILFVGNSLVSLDLGNENTVEISISKFESYVERKLITGLETRQRASLSDSARDYAAQFSSNDRVVALERYHIILPRLRGNKITGTPVSMRTVREWVKRFNDAKEKFGNGLLGLLPLHRLKGSDEPKIPDDKRQIMELCIEETYETAAERNITVSYGEFVCRCKKKGVQEDQIPVYSTYRNKIRDRAGQKQEKKRRGSRAAYQYEEFYWALEEKTLRHGEYPWQICHIDHTPLDILLVHWKTFKVLGIPTLTLLVDAYSRLVLAYYLSFDRESRKSLMMVTRDCARRHGRLPELVVVDKGSAFQSVYFDSVTAHYNCDKKVRPRAKARYGSVIERLFNTTNTQFIHNLMGNTKPWRNRRTITKEVNPRNLAIWNYGLLYEHLNSYFRGYNNREHPALNGLTPQEAFDAGMKQYELPYDEIIYDRNFMIETMPETPRGKGKIVLNRGVKFHYIFYNSVKFNRVKLVGTNVETRYDPYDASFIQAFVNGRWEEAVAPPSLYAMLKKCSEKDLMRMSEELRQRRRKHAGGFALRAEDVATYLADAEEDEEREYQRKLDAEAFKKSGGGTHSQELETADGTTQITSSKSRHELDQLRVYQKIRRNS